MVKHKHHDSIISLNQLTLQFFYKSWEPRILWSQGGYYLLSQWRVDLRSDPSHNHPEISPITPSYHIMIQKKLKYFLICLENNSLTSSSNSPTFYLTTPPNLTFLSLPLHLCCMWGLRFWISSKMVGSWWFKIITSNIFLIFSRACF